MADEPNDFCRTGYEVLPGLPPYGPPATVFSATGRGKHSEGLVVRFSTTTGDSWIGNFIGTQRGADGVFDHPNSVHVIVVASGQGYVVDPESQSCIHYFGGNIVNVLPLRELQLLLCGNGLWFEAIGPDAIAWRTRRISWDGMRHIECVARSFRAKHSTWMITGSRFLSIC